MLNYLFIHCNIFIFPKASSLHGPWPFPVCSHDVLGICVRFVFGFSSELLPWTRWGLGLCETARIPKEPRIMIFQKKPFLKKSIQIVKAVGNLSVHSEVEENQFPLCTVGRKAA